MAQRQSLARIEQLESLQGKNPVIAYVLNIPLPGLGNCFYGRPVMGILLMMIVFLAVVLFFAGGLAWLIGVILIIVSIIGAFFTLGLSLILLPLGLLMLVLGAGPLLSVIMYLFCLVVSELLVATKASQVQALTELQGHRVEKSYDDRAYLVSTVERVQALFRPSSARLPNRLLVGAMLALTVISGGLYFISNPNRIVLPTLFGSHLSGTIVDNFDKPLEGAIVKIPGTEFAARTNSRGDFKLRFVPGSFTIVAIKEGYSNVQRQLSLASSASVPLEQIQLWLFPKQNGLFVQGANGYLTSGCTLSIDELQKGFSRAEAIYNAKGAAISVDSPMAKFVISSENFRGPLLLSRRSASGSIGRVTKSFGQSRLQGFAQLEARSVAPSLFVAEAEIGAGEWVVSMPSHTIGGLQLLPGDRCATVRAMKDWEQACRGEEIGNPKRCAINYVGEEALGIQTTWSDTAAGDEFACYADIAFDLAAIAAYQTQLGQFKIAKETFAGAQSIAAECEQREGFETELGSILPLVAMEQAKAGDFDAALATANSIDDTRERDATLKFIALVEHAKAGNISAIRDLVAQITTAEARVETLTTIAAGVILEGAKNSEVAVEILNLAHKASEEISDNSAKADAFILIARLKAGRADKESARNSLVQAYAAAIAIESGNGPSYALASIAEIYSKIGDVERARQIIAEALAAATKIESASGRVYALSQIATASAEVEEIDSSRQMVADAFAIAAKIEGKSDRVYALLRIADVQTEFGDKARASETIAKARDAAAEITDSNESILASALANIAVALAENGEFGDAFDLVRIIGDADSRAYAYSRIALAAESRG